MSKKLAYAVIGISAVAGGYMLYRHFDKKRKGSMFDYDSKTVEKIVKPATTSKDFPIKKGSKGEKVKVLQAKLGLKNDGIFGAMTEAALKAQAGVTQIADEAQYQSVLDKLTKTAATAAAKSSNVDRCKQLFEQFQKGGVAIRPVRNTNMARGTFDTFGAWHADGTGLTLKNTVTYNNSDYRIVGYTGNTGRLEIEVTRGDLKGMYLATVADITLVKA